MGPLLGITTSFLVRPARHARGPLGRKPAHQAAVGLLAAVVIAGAAAALSVSMAEAQQRIDGSFPFDTDPAKKYSLYIPSGYQAGTPHRLMVGFHPLNTSRWDSESWCDTLIVFAEENDLLLACPDGGLDGRVDDPIDLAFTHALLDSMDTWYSVDAEKVYAMGFSWGGRATYRFGLMNPDIFGGFVPIGAAINGTSEVEGIIQNAVGKAFYLVHGANDSPNTRYYPIRQALIDNGAIVESLLMPGVGHTIDFPNRNAILGVAFQWVDSVNCALDPTSVPDLGGTNDGPNREGEVRTSRLALAGNPLEPGGTVLVSLSSTFSKSDPQATRVVELLDLQGRLLGSWTEQSLEFAAPVPHTRGSYFLRVTGPEGVASAKVIVR